MVVGASSILFGSNPPGLRISSKQAFSSFVFLLYLSCGCLLYCSRNVVSNNSFREHSLFRIATFLVYYFVMGAVVVYESEQKVAGIRW